jgi:hypothetical protein
VSDLIALYFRASTMQLVFKVSDLLLSFTVG